MTSSWSSFGAHPVLPVKPVDHILHDSTLAPKQMNDAAVQRCPRVVWTSHFVAVDTQTSNQLRPNRPAAASTLTLTQQPPVSVFVPSVLIAGICAHENILLCVCENKPLTQPSPLRTLRRLCVALQGGVRFHKWRTRDKVGQSGLFKLDNIAQEPRILPELDCLSAGRAEGMTDSLTH